MCRKPRVYLIDDQADIRDAARMLLNLEGMETKTFHSGQCFLESIRASRELPDCIISDLGVFSGSGDNALDSLTELDERIPIIILSADSAPLRKHKLCERVAATLTKPVRADELIREIRRVLKVVHDDPQSGLAGRTSRGN